MTVQPSPDISSLHKEESGISHCDYHYFFTVISEISSKSEYENKYCHFSLSDFCKDEKSQGFVCDSEYIVDLRNMNDDKATLTELAEGLEKIFFVIQETSSMIVSKYAIGVLPITTKKDEAFDPKNCNTWNMSGILSKWETHKNEDFGQSGLVVLTAIDKGAVPSNYKDSMDQRGYAVHLLSKFCELIENNNDERLENLENQTYKKSTIAHALYIAYTLGDGKKIGTIPTPLHKSGKVHVVIHTML